MLTLSSYLYLFPLVGYGTCLSYFYGAYVPSSMEYRIVGFQSMQLSSTVQTSSHKMKLCRDIEAHYLQQEEPVPEDEGDGSAEEFQLALFKNRKKENLFANRIFDLFDVRRKGVIDFGDFVRSLSVFHPNAPQEDKINSTMDPIRLGYRELFRVSAIMEPVRFGYTEFSVPVTTSLLASIFLPPLHFWIAFPIIICLRGWVDVIWNQLKATTVAIIWTTHQEVQPETEPAAAQFQEVAIVGDEHSQREQSTLDCDIGTGIDEQP
ncbi:hypothetical protein F0562_012556 [Nyssa sinensis]|uniref:Calcineurin B-like protein n=1 Tax=Nyssa sinensis TaxID=561372 RepID=A0A5J4ZUV8_9ASTE|nr:hypothetical protein F0562_012556 [Nyssa sinensis]